MIYFAQGKTTRNIKIGYSKQVEGRLGALQCGSSEELELLLVIPGSQEAEVALHELLEDDRERGEWFKPTPRVMTLIRALKLITSDADSGEQGDATKEPTLTDIFTVPISGVERFFFNWRTQARGFKFWLAEDKGYVEVRTTNILNQEAFRAAFMAHGINMPKRSKLEWERCALVIARNC